MYLGKVIGTVVSTSKNEKLIGMKFLVIRRLDEHKQPTSVSEIAVDSVGAGTGESFSSAKEARRAPCLVTTFR